MLTWSEEGLSRSRFSGDAIHCPKASRKFVPQCRLSREYGVCHLCPFAFSNTAVSPATVVVTLAFTADG